MLLGVLVSVVFAFSLTDDSGSPAALTRMLAGPAEVTQAALGVLVIERGAVGWAGRQIGVTFG